MDVQNTQPSNPGSSLAELFRFGPDELASNREGVVAEGQISLLWSSIVPRVGESLLLLALVALAVVVMRWGGQRYHPPNQASVRNPDYTLVEAPASRRGGVGILLVAMLFVAYGVGARMPSLRDLTAPTVATVEGPVFGLPSLPQKSGTPVLTIGDEELRTNDFWLDVRYGGLSSQPRQFVRDHVDLAAVFEETAIYRAYYLPNSKILLSIERLVAPEHAASPSSFADVFRFGDAQLEANRAGRVADDQVPALPWGQVLLGVLGCVVALVLAVGAATQAHGAFRVLGPLLGLVVLLVVGVIAYPTLADSIRPEVATAEGSVVVTTASGDTRAPPYPTIGLPHRAVLTIDGRRLTTAALFVAASRVVIGTATYRVYYLARTRRVLSIERTNASDGDREG